VCQLMEYDVIGRSVKAVFTTNSDAGMQWATYARSFPKVSTFRRIE
jgi:hypothetical protein